MFGRVSISNDRIAPDELAKALVYYTNVRVYVDRGTLVALIKVLGQEALLNLLDTGQLELRYGWKKLAVVTNRNPLPVYDFGALNLVQTASKGIRFHNHADEVHSTLSDEFGKSKSTKDLANKILSHMKVDDNSKIILDTARSNSADQNFMPAIVRDILVALVPDYPFPEKIKFETAETGAGLLVACDLDFAKINKVYHQSVSPEHSSISEPYILANLLTGIERTLLAASSDSELWANAATASVARAKIGSLVQRTDRSRKNIDLFRSIEFDDIEFGAPILSGERSFADLLHLLQKREAVEFKDWLLEQPDDGSLVREYHKALFSDSGWQNRLPFKLGKMFVFAGVGVGVDALLGSMGIGAAASVIGGAIDLATGASDEFLLSKLSKGWKPNQFVEGPAREYLGIGRDK